MLYPLKQKLPFNMRYRGALRGRERTSFKYLEALTKSIKNY